MAGIFNNQPCKNDKIKDMTIEEFNNSGFGTGDRALYHGEIYLISALDFEEKLVGLLLHISGGDPEEISWVRCENITHLSGIDSEILLN